MVAFLSCLLTAWFAHQKHYTARRGRWTELKHILIGIAFMALIDGWAHYALKMQASRLWQVQLWVYAGVFIIVGRLLTQRLLEAIDCWRCPTLLVGRHRRARRDAGSDRERALPRVRHPRHHHRRT